MKYRVTQPFLAFGKAPQAGDVVELTPEQATALREVDCVVEYEVKVMPLPENKRTKKASGSSRQARPRKKTTRKVSKKSAKK